MKKVIKRLLDSLEVALVRKSNDPLLQEMLSVYGFLKLGQPKVGEAEQRLCNLAFSWNLRELLGSLQISCAFDVGANAGQFGRLLRKLGYKDLIFSFEPASCSRAQLETESSSDPNWHVLPFALGSEACVRQLSVYGTDTFSSVHKVSKAGEKNFGDFLQEPNAETVEMRTLDEVVASLGDSGARARFLLKTDTQGHDLEVMKGARKSFERVDIVVTEASVEPIYEDAPLYDELFSFLGDQGFIASGFYPSGHRKDRLIMMEFDAIFVRKAAAKPPLSALPNVP